MTPYIKNIIKYGVIIFILLSTFKISELLLLNSIMSLDTYSFLIAIISILIGIYYSTKLSERKISSPYLTTIPIESNSVISKREMEVLLLLSKGLTNKEISNLLFISLNTTKTHLSSIYSKLGTNNRVQTIKAARESGIIEY